MHKLTGKKIFVLRQKNGTTQKELADFVGVKTPCLSLWESGQRKISAKHLQKIAQFFNVTVDYLLEPYTREPNEKEKELIEQIKALTEEQCQKLLTMINNIEESEPLFNGKAKEYIDFLLSKK